MRSKCTIIIGPHKRRNRSGEVIVKPHKRKQWHVSYKTPAKIVHDVIEYNSSTSARKAGTKRMPEIKEKYGDAELLVSPITVLNGHFEKGRDNARRS